MQFDTRPHGSRFAAHEVDKLNTRDTLPDDGLPTVDLAPARSRGNFFHDPSMWAVLESAIQPRLLEARVAKRALRVWVLGSGSGSGSGSGEEGYSVAMKLCEALEAAGLRDELKLRIFVTDTDPDVVCQARRGWFPVRIADEISPDRLARFFVEEEGGYRIKREIRDVMTFAAHDLRTTPPLTRLDLVFCRRGEGFTQSIPPAALIPLFHYCLIRDGLLVLNADQSTAGCEDLFAPATEVAPIYRRLPGPARTTARDFIARAEYFAMGMRPAQDRPSLRTVVDTALLQHFSPPAVLVNDAGDILYFSGRTADFLDIPPQLAAWNIYTAASRELRGILTTAIERVLRDGTQLVLPAVDVGRSGKPRHVQVSVRPIKSMGLAAALVVFGRPKYAQIETTPTDESGAGLQRQLADAGLENIQLLQQMNELREKLGNANEELQSMNEELLATNDDLRISNDQVQESNDRLVNSLTQREEARRRIETLSHRLISIQELERRRLSGELHDRTSPNLATMDILLKSLVPALPDNLSKEVSHLLEDFSALLEDTTASIREICADLRPPVLDHAGLVPALESYAQQYSSRTGTAVEVNARDHSPRLSAEHQSLLFRIAQEALTNCAKHARASRIGIELASGEGYAVMTISDNGIGFAPEALTDPEQPPGLGLLTMRERAEFAGGLFNVVSHPGQGTKITVEIAEDAD